MSVCNKQKSVELKHRESHFESHLRVALIQGRGFNEEGE